MGSSEESQEKSPSESTPEAASSESAVSSEAAASEVAPRQESEVVASTAGAPGQESEASSSDGAPGQESEASSSGGAAGQESAEASSGGAPGQESEAAASSVGSPSGAEASGAEEDEASELLAAPEERLAGRVVTVLMPLERLEDESAYRLRPEGDVSGLATDIARLGQLFPVDVRPRGNERYQLVCGFRRVAALRFLKRDAVQARVHTDLSDEDALLMSLAEAIHATPVEPEVLEAKRDQLESEGRLSAAVADMLAKALATDESLAPEGVEEEIDADELASDVSQRLGAINQDLSLLADVFASLDESRRAELLMQLRYSSELVAYLEGLS
ncbi:ParB/RepB/Spo0J family partition protein [Myxococcus faecalis]|uniref:ParB/RepB/Spo0J family partition protein n=1 Tax=Myxococcus faecalis TaxID=3115646 RepID=UPI003CEEE3C3